MKYKIPNIGDLVRVEPCPAVPFYGTDPPCGCWKCVMGGNKLGLVIAVAEYNGWLVQFDIGQWRLYPEDFESGSAEVVCEGKVNKI